MLITQAPIKKSSDRAKIKRKDSLVTLFKPFEEIEQRIIECFEFLRGEHESRLKAQNINRRKDEFLAVVSHELRNTVHSIGGWTNLLCNGNLNETSQRQALEAIQRSVRLQTKLVEDLLDASQINSGTLRLNLREVIITPIIEGVLNDVKVLADAKQIEFEATLAQNLGNLMADSVRLEQVLWNLLSNAIKFTPREGKVWVNTKRTNLGLEIEVADTGRGIDSEFLPLIFDPFSQSEPFIDGKQNGLGLGLSIVRQIIELHGGRIEAHSAGCNQGASFRIRIPNNSTI